jgi:hypothetical protein
MQPGGTFIYGACSCGSKDHAYSNLDSKCAYCQPSMSYVREEFGWSAEGKGWVETEPVALCGCRVHVTGSAGFGQRESTKSLSSSICPLRDTL